jgi:hypothetical protein
MSADEGKRKARAAVQAMFDRYKLLASKRPKDHVVSILMFGPELMNADLV